MAWYVWGKCSNSRNLQHKVLSGVHGVNHNVLCEYGGKILPPLATFSDVVLYYTLIINVSRKMVKKFLINRDLNQRRIYSL